MSKTFVVGTLIIGAVCCGALIVSTVYHQNKMVDAYLETFCGEGKEE